MSAVERVQLLLHSNAGGSYGMGHLMRCLTLGAEAANRGWNVTLTGDLDETAISVARTTLRDAEIVPAARESHHDSLPALATRVQADVVHIDSYWPESNALLTADGVISNMQDGTFGVRKTSLAIDANLGGESWFAEPALSDVHLAGITTTIVRQQVRELRGQWRASTRGRRLLIVLGGTDPHGATSSAIDTLATVIGPLEVTAVAPRATRAAVELAASRSPHQVNVVDFLADLPRVAMQHDLVISAAGTSVWDFACLGVPMALVCAADNQELGYAAAVKDGLAAGLGRLSPEESSTAAVTVQNLLEDETKLRALSMHGLEAVDGLGAWRIVEAWAQLVHAAPTTKPQSATTIGARHATIADAQMLFDWRNDPTTRKMSRSSDELSWDEHVSWVARVIDDPQRHLLVVEDGSQAVGTVRWDLQSGIDWEASISLAPASRGAGLSYAVLAAGEATLLSLATPARLIATIHDDNPASRRLFLRSGYFPYRPADQTGFATYARLELPRKADTNSQIG